MSDNDTPEPDLTEGETADGGDSKGDAGPRRAGVAWLALLLALAALGAAGWQWWKSAGEQAVTPAELNALHDRVAAANERSRRVDDIGERLAELERRFAEAEQAADRLRGRVEGGESAAREAVASVESVHGELAAIQRRVENLERAGGRRADGPGPHLRLALAEAEFLVRSGYRLLELDADVERALQALAQADQTLATLDVAGVGQARRALSSEIEALRSVPRVDRAGLAARLAALAGRVDALPLAGVPRTGVPAAAVDHEAKGWWAATRSFLGRYFTVRRTGEEGADLPDPDTLALARQILRLELEQARAAVWRRDGEHYRAALSRAGEMTGRYFDGESEAVTRFREGLDELRESEIAPSLPEPGAALAAVRELRDGLPGGG